MYPSHTEIPVFIEDATMCAHTHHTGFTFVLVIFIVYSIPIVINILTVLKQFNLFNHVLMVNYRFARNYPLFLLAILAGSTEPVSLCHFAVQLL